MNLKSNMLIIITFIILLITTIHNNKRFQIPSLMHWRNMQCFLRYKIVDSPLVVFGGISLNVLIVNIIGSFILGYFLFYLLHGILMRNTHSCLLLVFVVH
jgi:hypothetical protein